MTTNESYYFVFKNREEYIDYIKILYKNGFQYIGGEDLTAAISNEFAEKDNAIVVHMQNKTLQYGAAETCIKLGYKPMDVSILFWKTINKI